MTNNNDILSLRKQLGLIATAQQRQAADPKKSVWVGASAGTGKTKVLSDRVLRLLLSGVNPSKILCLTYTKAAAVEMNSRVAERLSRWAIISEDELEKELLSLFGKLPDDSTKFSRLKSRARQLFATLLDVPGGIKIQTIHSFCQEVLKRFPLEAGISPYFDIMDDRNAIEAINEVKSKLFQTAGLHPNSELALAIDYLTFHVNERGFSDIINSIINNRGKINRTIEKHGGKDNLISVIAQKLKVDDNLTEVQVIKDFFDNMPIDNLRRLASSGMDSLYPWIDGQNFDSLDYDTYSHLFLTSKDEIRSPTKMPYLKKDPSLKKIFDDEANRCLELFQKLKSVKIYLSTKAVLQIASALLDGYNEFKQKHARLDYDDMILLTRNLLENKDAARWVLFKLDGGIDNILIDEAQDTSPDQWAIVQSISDEFFAGLGSSENTRTIFAVGDRKQSIYSFQGADPDKFDEMRDHFSALAPDFEKINLEISFRSAPAILEAVNQLFDNDQVSKGVASEGETIHHRAFREGESGEVEFWEMIEPDETRQDDKWHLPDHRIHTVSTSSQMAKMIASKIHSMVASEEILKSKNRPLQYGDFLILVRSRDSFCEELIRECKNLNINVSGIDRIHLMEQIAVQDMISLGKFLLLPEDDLSLAELLKSPLFGLNDDDLFKLCYRRKGTLWNSLLTSSEFSDVAEQLKQLFNNIDYMRPFELYNFVLGKMGGRKKYYQRMGPEAEDGLDEFINLSLSFETDHIPTLQNFIEWILADDVEIKREMESGKNNMVRLMTVHGSKGLQAPIVILPDTTRVPNCNREAGILWDNDIFLYPTQASDFNDYCDKLNEKQKIKMLEEYRRLMYVAVTRAEDRMIFCGFRKKVKAPETSWYSMFKSSFTKIASLDEKSNVWTYRNEQIINVEKTKQSPITTVNDTLPEFFFTPAEAEKPLAKPLSPSKPDDEPATLSPLVINNDALLYKRGSLIHKLLQFLPDISQNLHHETIHNFLKNKAPELSEHQREKICNEIFLLLQNPEFKAVFGPNSKAEVPIMGEIDGKIISGQIDRLVIEQNQIIVVDYKTNRNPAKTLAEVPNVYRSQLGAYKALLQKIYPQKNIKTFILWTNNANMMQI